MRVLALDIGKKRIGVASGDTDTRIATPVRVMPAHEVTGNARTWQRLLEDYEPELLICGLPLSMSGQAGMQARAVREQAQAHIETFAQIAKILGIKCRMVGEEPTDEITNEINKAMTELMPKFGLEPVIIPRLEIEGTLVTGTLTRGLAEEKRDDELARFVPETTLRVIRGEMI